LLFRKPKQPPLSFGESASFREVSHDSNSDAEVWHVSTYVLIRTQEPFEISLSAGIRRKGSEWINGTADLNRLCGNCQIFAWFIP